MLYRPVPHSMRQRKMGLICRQRIAKMAVLYGGGGWKHFCCISANWGLLPDNDRYDLKRHAGTTDQQRSV